MYAGGYFRIKISDDYRLGAKVRRIINLAGNSVLVANCVRDPDGE